MDIKIEIDGLIKVLKELDVEKDLLELVKNNLFKNYTNISHWCELCSVLRRIKNYHASFETYETALRLFPHEVVLYNNKCLLLIEWERYDEALVAIDKAILLDPNYIKAISNKARVFEKFTILKMRYLFMNK